ncbi:MAG: hypothetical protein WC243_03695 [Patescibacteria group bacterium]|jgi:hypothetical protein
MEITSTCQFDSDFPVQIKNNLCGVLSMYKVIDFFGKPLPKLKEFFNEFVSFGKYTLPTINVIFHDSGIVSIPIRFLDSNVPSDTQLSNARELFEGGDIQLEIVEHSSNSYLPTFLLDRGSDSRGISAYMKGLGFNNALIEKKDANEEEFTGKFLIESKVHPVVASVLMRKLKHLDDVAQKYYGNIDEITHLVVVVPNIDDNRVTLWDPAICSKFSDHVFVDTQEFLSALCPDERLNSHFVFFE